MLQMAYVTKPHNRVDDILARRLQPFVPYEYPKKTHLRLGSANFSPLLSWL